MKTAQSNTALDVMDFRKQGQLAYIHCGKRLDLRVLKSNAGWYIGTADHDGPCSREAVGYFPSEEAATMALQTGQWTQKLNP